MSPVPAYLGISDPEWNERLHAARGLFAGCRCCPRQCRVDRPAGEKGFCGAGAEIVVASSGPHFGEEPPISGTRGSGAVFFTHCTMRCVYCQNYPFSRLGQGRVRSAGELAACMTMLQEKGCHNINLVTPAHFIPPVIQALRLAVDRGLRIPIVYNTSSFENPEVLSLLDGIVDIFLADMRYADPAMSERYSGVREYPEKARDALKEMYRQVGPLMTDHDGIGSQGLIVRHLVLPNGIAGSREVFSFIATELSKDVPVSLMSQYYPAYQAIGIPELSRPITAREYEEALQWLEESGLTEGWRQGLEDEGE
ncbi:MAG: radical SAM protein [bacterium]